MNPTEWAEDAFIYIWNVKESHTKWLDEIFERIKEKHGGK